MKPIANLNLQLLELLTVVAGSESDRCLPVVAIHHPPDINTFVDEQADLFDDMSSDSVVFAGDFNCPSGVAEDCRPDVGRCSVSITLL